MAQHSWIGETLGGRYKIEDILGKGGMSAVYKASDPNLKRVVAIKLIHPHLSDNPEFVVRFKEEAAAVAQFRHSNIVQVFDFNNQGDTYYMVLEFVPGETLQARLKRLNATDRRLPTPDVIKIASQICDAADYAHRRSLVHRDIKPANVMLDVHGQAILMDFGIAKIVGGQFHTATGATVGTASYMSPEQIRGERVDERSDVYSIGVTLFEMVSGRPPYEAESAMTLMMMHLNDPLPDLRQLQPYVPADLVAVIEKALAKDRDARFQSAGEMATALRQVLDRVQSAADGATVVEAPQRDELPLDRTVAEMRMTRGAPATPAPVTGAAASRDVAAAPARGTPAVQQQGAGDGVVAPKPTSLAGRKLSPAVIGAGIGGAMVLIALALVLSGLFSGDGEKPAGENRDSADAAAALVENATGTAVALASIDTPTTEPSATVAPTATEEPPSATPAPAATSTPTTQPTATTEPPTATSAPIYSPTPTRAPIYSPTPTSAPTAIPTSTPPSSPYYVRITRITAQDNVYAVDYETIGFTESLTGFHVHFFFDTVSFENAGMPGQGPWIPYYGPIPFMGYTTGDRPDGATQMCARVANADHSLYYPVPDYVGSDPGTGNCVDLP